MSCKGSVVVGVASMVFVSGGTGTCVEATSLASTSLVLVDMNEYAVSVAGGSILWLAVTTTESVR